ncbi:MAG: family 43 glycosylhydrolase [Chitinophagaceae bacterium]
MKKLVAECTVPFHSSLLFFSCLLLLLTGNKATAQKTGSLKYNAIYSGIPWFDDRGNVLSAHAACIIRENDRYYLFGERHSDTSNAFEGFNCYSSTDLYNWKFESIALARQDSGKLGPDRVGERVKVMKCPSTGEYIMYMHADNIQYKDQSVGYAVAKNITGPYIFQGSLLFNGSPVRKWDMGAFQDKDGSGYILIHGGDIFKLSSNYKSIEEQVAKGFAPGSESPAILRKDSLYYWLGSHLTSWERNDNFYYTATSLKGPWTSRGKFTPDGTLTWNSQTTFVLPVEGSKETTFMFMGDRWSFPKQASAATYVWQPLTVAGTSLSIPVYKEAWRVNTSTGIVTAAAVASQTINNTDTKTINYSGQWKHTADIIDVTGSDTQGDSFSIQFNGKQVGLYFLSTPNSGYARVQITNKKGITVLTCLIDLYCNYPLNTLKFLSPLMTKDAYTLTLTVMGEHSKWSDKKKADYGSKGDSVALHKIVIIN